MTPAALWFVGGFAVGTAVDIYMTAQVFQAMHRNSIPPKQKDSP